MRSYLINYARSLIYTTFMPFPSLAAIKAAYSLLQNGHTETLAAHLKRMTWHFQSSLITMLRRHSGKGRGGRTLHISPICPQSPIFALETEHARSLAKHCQDSGFMVRAVVPPTVPTRRVRVCLHAGNTVEEIDSLLRAIEQWLVRQNESTDVSRQPESSAVEGFKARL